MGSSERLESSKLLCELPAEFHVLAYESNRKTWESPFNLIQSEGETVVVQKC